MGPSRCDVDIRSTASSVITAHALHDQAPERPLRVGLIAPPWVPVPPPVYGGTELVIDLLARGLVEAGHHVVLFSTGDATCPVDRRWRYPRALGTTADFVAELAHVETAYRAMADVDIIHDHTMTGPTWAELPPEGTPVVTTVHGPFTAEFRHLYATAARRGARLIAISHHQRRSAPEVPIAGIIHHGVDVNTIPVGDGDGGYVLFLGRMHPDKGAHRAIAAARAAGRQIVLAAKMWEPAERRYFAERVEPMLGRDAVYVGECGAEEKLELLRGADALVNPIRWPEPFGLVMAEALACGTPVVAFREGAAPEIIDHGSTGFLCMDQDELAANLSRIGEIKRSTCRAAAESRFSTQRMVNDHMSLYRPLATAITDAASGHPCIPGMAIGSSRSRRSEHVSCR